MGESNRPIRVLFFVAEFFHLQGSQRSLLALLRVLPQGGVEPVVVFPGEGRCTEAYRRAGLQVIVLPTPAELNLTGKALLRLSVVKAGFMFATRVLAYNWKLARLARKLNADVFHFNTPRSILLGGLSSVLCRKPSVLHIRGQLHVLGRMHRFVSQLIPARMILVSEVLRSHIYPIFRRKCLTIHTGIDESDLPRGRNHNGATSQLSLKLDGRPVICTFGAVCPFKGYHHLIRASHLLGGKSGPQPIFLAIGEIVDQPYYSYLQRLLKRYELTNFHFLGWQENAVVFYQKADMIVLPSVEEESLKDDGINIEIKGNEGLPRAVLEAMYLGKAVIATRVAGTGEQIEDGTNGLLVQPGNPNQLAEAIQKLLEDSALRVELGQKASSRVHSDFSKQKNAY